MNIFKQTYQRKAIMEFLEGNKDHPSAEDIYRAVNKDQPSISLATVYNTLKALKDKGLISELTVGSTKRRFDSNTINHHHFICLKCGNIYDIEEKIRLSIPTNLNQRFQIVSEQVDLYGYCEGCNALNKLEAQRQQGLPLEG